MSVNYTVSVRLMTYNHSEFIDEAIRSILQQKTNFLVEIVVGDDFSTDDTLEKIKRYVDVGNFHFNVLKRVRGDDYWQKRQKLGRLYNFTNIIENCSGKYIVLLDGDDYWTDPFKLQKQVNVLEKKHDIILCYHWQSFKYGNNANTYYGETLGENQPIISTVKDLFKWGIRIESRTVMFRNIFNKVDFPKWFYKVSFGDISLNFILAAYGNFYFINENMAVYRVNENGFSLIGKNDIDKKRWKINHSYKWLDIWIYAYNYHKRRFGREAFEGFKKFLLPTLKIENMASSILKQCYLHITHPEPSSFLLKKSISFILIHHFKELYSLLKRYLLNFKRKLIKKLIFI